MPSVRKKKNWAAAPIIFMFFGASLIVAALILGSPRNSGPADLTSQEHAEEDTFPEIQRVSMADSRAAYDNGAAVFVDVRDASSYAESHVPGALSIPLAELEERLGELNPADWIITYCT